MRSPLSVRSAPGWRILSPHSEPCGRPADDRYRPRARSVGPDDVEAQAGVDGVERQPSMEISVSSPPPPEMT